MKRFCGATEQYHLIGENFSISLKKDLRFLNPSESKSKEPLTSLHFAIKQREIYHRRWRDFYSSLYSPAVTLDWKSAHSCAFSMPHPQGNNFVHICVLSEGLRGDLLVYEYSPFWILPFLFSNNHIRVLLKLQLSVQF